MLMFLGHVHSSNRVLITSTATMEGSPEDTPCLRHFVICELLRRQSRTRSKSFKSGDFNGGPPRRRSIAGTFVMDPSLKLPPRPKANRYPKKLKKTSLLLDISTPVKKTGGAVSCFTIFAHDGKRDEGNGVYEKDEKVKEPEGDYDPYQERVVDHPTTNMETLLHLLKGSLGTGILAMPNAFHNAGWALGLVGTIIIGIICTFCIHLLIKCEYELCKRRRIPALNYPATAEAGLQEGPTIFTKLAPISGHVVNFFVLAYQLGICCVYVVFVASNVKDVVDEYWYDLDVRIYMVIFLLPLILINYVRNLKYLAPFSAISNIITFIGFGITLYYIFAEVHGIDEREAIGEVKNWPLFFGTVLFSLEAIGVIMPLENEMKSPKSFGGPVGVLNVAMALIIALYVGMGFFGYLRYGADAKGSITLNIPSGDPLAQVVKITMAFAIFITHALQNYVAIDIVWNGYLAPSFEKNAHKLYYEYAVRTLLVLFTFLMGVLIPNLEHFIAFVGAVTLSLLALFFPVVIETSTFWYSKKGLDFYWMMARNVFISIFALMGLIIGGFTSVQSIINSVFT
ncbi:hypothetical protein RUM43_002625 [Polyplax serrata]|uniref:Amino acid transporter transmembrane domain-containing protein n=1 Tax=Polyplax serrata TaxID=468196 RepID=A0AAN8S647_POLSC